MTTHRPEDVKAAEKDYCAWIESHPGIYESLDNTAFNMLHNGYMAGYLKGIAHGRANPEPKRTWLEECERLEAEAKLKKATIGGEG